MMCTVSDQLKLCTCKTEDIEQLKQYWILYKHQKSKMVMIGEPLLPQGSEISEENDEYNKATLSKLLNERNCFDINLTIHNGDILELNFSCPSKTQPEQTVHLTYEFVYKKSKWITHESDPFNTNKVQKHQGKIKNAFDNFSSNE